MGDFFEIGVRKPYKIRAEDSEKLYFFIGGTLCLKSFVTTAVVLMSTKPGSMPASALPIPMAVQTISRPAFLPFPKGSEN